MSRLGLPAACPCCSQHGDPMSHFGQRHAAQDRGTPRRRRQSRKPPTCHSTPTPIHSIAPRSQATLGGRTGRQSTGEGDTLTPGTTATADRLPLTPAGGAPKTGRFIGRDPVAGSTASPQSLNGYAYASNNPVMRSDPSGMEEHAIPSDPPWTP